MAMYLELPVYKVAFDLTVEFARARQILPRDARYTIGQDMSKALAQVLVLICRACIARDKIDLIREMRALINLRTQLVQPLRSLGRLSCDCLRFRPGVFASAIRSGVSPFLERESALHPCK